MTDVSINRLLDEEQAHEAQDLSRGLKDRHIQLIASGGAIGVGLFLGSARAISKAGPGLMLSYAVGGLVIFFITCVPSGNCCCTGR
jgi:AAT family amino acid transporter/D-serine/D-alanine/glycine transporter